MNEICKTAIKDKLIIALEKEGLSKIKAGELLEIKPQYLSMVLKAEQWGKFPESTWDILQKWVNSDQGIIEYSEKHGKVLTEKPKKDEPIIKVKPEALEKRKKELAEKEKRATKGQLIDMLIQEKELLKSKIIAIDILLKHYIE
jgi:hypothetical protein